MVEAAKPKTEKELKKEAEKAAKLAKFEEKQKKMAEKQRITEENAKKDDKKKKEKKEILEYVSDVPLGEKKDISGDMPAAYSPKYVEAAWYQWWEKQGFFKPEYGGRDLQ